MITHDAHLAESVADSLWLVRHGNVAPYDGDLQDYRTLVLDAGKTGSGNGKKTGLSVKSQARQSAAANREALAPLKKKAAEAEKKLDELNSVLIRLDNALAAPDLYENPARMTKLNRERAALAEAISIAEENWLLALEYYEQEKEAGTTSR